MKRTQAFIVLKHMKQRGSITAFEAIMDHHITSLSRRICDLKEQGYIIHKQWKVNPVTKKRYVRYTLGDDE